MAHRPTALMRLIVALALVLQVVLPVLPALPPPPVALAAEVTPPVATAAPEVAPLPPTRPFTPTVTRPPTADLPVAPGAESAPPLGQAPTASELPPTGDAPGLPCARLALQVTPESATPGSEVTLQWQLTNCALAPLAGLTLALRLPAELAVVPERLPAGWDYAEQLRVARYRLPELAAEAVVRGEFTVRVAQLRAGDATAVAAELLAADGRAVTQAAATLLGARPAPQITVLDAAGGTVGLEDGRVTLTFAPGAVATAVTVQAQPLGRPAEAPGNVLRAYEFLVRDAAGQEVTHLCAAPHPDGALPGG